MFYHPWIALSLLILPNFALAFNWFQNDAQQAETTFNQGHYSQAAELFTDPYQKGVALYRDGKYAQAAQAFAASQREEVKIDALYNLGNAYFQQGQFQEAIHAYESVLAQQPHHEDAKHNLASAKQQQSTPNSSSQPQNSPQEKGNQNAQTGQHSNSNNNAEQSHQSAQNSSTEQNPQGKDSQSQLEANANNQANSSPPAQANQKDSRPQEIQSPTPSQAAHPEKNDGNTQPPSNVNMAKDRKDNQPPVSSEQNMAISQEKPAGKPSDPFQGIPENLISSPEKFLTEADLMANVLLDRIDDSPRQLLQRQFLIDAYNAKREKPVPEKPW